MSEIEKALLAYGRLCILFGVEDERAFAQAGRPNNWPQSAIRPYEQEKEAALEKLRGLLAATLKAEGTPDLVGVLTDVAQLLDGWHQDGTAWSEWDESVRQRVSDALMDLYGQPHVKLFNRGATIVEAPYVHSDAEEQKAKDFDDRIRRSPTGRRDMSESERKNG